MTLQLLAKYKGKKTLFLLLFKAASQKEPTPLNEHLQRQWETCGPPRATRSKRRVMFTFSRPHWGVGVKLNGGGLRNQWVAQGLLLDRGDPDLAVLLAATSARVCAHRLVILETRAGIWKCQDVSQKYTKYMHLRVEKKSLNRKCWQENTIRGDSSKQQPECLIKKSSCLMSKLELIADLQIRMGASMFVSMGEQMDG